MPLQADEYMQFLERSRDKIAEWIDHPKVKALFAEDMNEREEDFKRYKAAAEENLQIEKNKDKRYVEWTKKNPAGQPHIRKLRKFYKDEQRYNDGLTNKHPGEMPIADFNWSEPPNIDCFNPLAKYEWPIMPNSFIINDYRVLLGVIHDCVTKDKKDLSDYICPDLWGTETFQFALYIMVKNNPEYQALVKKALRIVGKDLREKGLLGEGGDGHDNGGKAGDRKQGAPETKPDSTSAQSIHIQNFQGILGDVQAENVQTGDKTLIHKHSETEKKKKGILRNLWWIITAIVGCLGSILGILNHLGWLESLKLFFYKLFIHK